MPNRLPRRAALLALAALSLPLPVRPQPAPAPAGGEPPPTAILFFIGDGLGFSQLALTRNLHYGQGKRLALESLPVKNFMTTWSSSNAVTDSGAAATAMAASVKTDNKVVGLGPAGETVYGFADLAQKQGWRIGYVTTTRITHATPASFYAHVQDRNDEERIARQLLMQRPDVALGGGLGFFQPASEQGRRKDGCNLALRAEKLGYSVWTRGADLSAPRPDRLLGLFANDHITYVLDDRHYPKERQDPSLAAMTGLALDVLARGGKPFFLMVEGGRIDHAGHGFDAAGVAAETRAFDEAVGVALRYQGEHPETLIVLTADHATGGLALNDYVDWQGLKRQEASVASLVRQIRNAGAGRELLASQTGYPDWSDAEVEEVRKAGSDDDAERVLGDQLGRSGRNGVTWMPRITPATFGHTGEDVPFLAGGPGAERFRGSLDNAQIPALFAELLGWPWPPGATDWKDRADPVPEECQD